MTRMREEETPQPRRMEVATRTRMSKAMTGNHPLSAFERFSALTRDRRGAGGAEYALLLVAILVVVAAAYRGLAARENRVTGTSEVVLGGGDAQLASGNGGPASNGGGPASNGGGPASNGGGPTSVGKTTLTSAGLGASGGTGADTAAKVFNGNLGGDALGQPRAALPPVGGTTGTGFGGALGGERPRTVPGHIWDTPMSLQQETELMQRAYDAARNSDRPVALGRMESMDLQSESPYTRLDALGLEAYTPRVNDAFVEGAMDRSRATGQPIVLANDPYDPHSLSKVNQGNPAVYFRELQQLRHNGFTLTKDRAYPPGAKIPKQ